METSLLLTLAFCLLFAILLYYVFIVRNEVDLGSHGKAGLFTTLFVILPVLAIVLWDQSGSEDRLRKIGFVPYPGFESSVGVATGAGKNPVWIFSSEGDDDEVLQFYRMRENHAGWSLVSESQSALMFEKGNEKLTIHVGDGNVIFSLRPGV